MITRCFPILLTPDMRRALTFYVDALGGRIGYRYPQTGEPVYVTVRLGSSSVGIAADASGDGPSAAFELCAYTRDVDAAVARLRTAQVRVVDEPSDQPWGERMARVLDPDGNRVSLFGEEGDGAAIDSETR
jgi:lactoylglutathione lyase